MTDQTLEYVVLRCRGCQTAYPAALEYACSRCLGPLDPEYDSEEVAKRLSCRPAPAPATSPPG
jgi:threonine synthase